MAKVIKKGIIYFLENPFLVAWPNKVGRVPKTKLAKIIEVGTKKFSKAYSIILLNKKVPIPIPIPIGKRKRKLFLKS